MFTDLNQWFLTFFSEKKNFVAFILMISKKHNFNAAKSPGWGLMVYIIIAHNLISRIEILYKLDICVALQ